ncbi:sortase [Streptomyces sp. NPDC015125]|uniref:sortase n=1 Tax=Streptomyces sp. NPDC015125 TaxID=3364938 RepID=UPI003700F5C3
MPENHPQAPEAAESDLRGDAARRSRARRNVLIGAAVATAVAVGLTAVRWGHASTGHVAEAKATAAAQRSTPMQDPLTTRSPQKAAADHTGKASDQAHKTLHSWSKSNPATRGNKHTVSSDPDVGVGGRIHEVLRIPALGASWAQPVYEGVGSQQLRAGVGHFDGTAEPGQIGNFGLAGHRSGVADPPFRDVDRLKLGSSIKVTAADRKTYTYAVTRIRVVEPSNVNVLLPVPGNPNTVPTKAKLTLVTCWPATGHSKRVIVEADLTSSKGGV